MIKIAKNLFQITPRNTPFTPRNDVLLQEMTFYSKKWRFTPRNTPFTPRNDVLLQGF